MGIFGFIKKCYEAVIQEQKARQDRLLQWQKLLMPDITDDFIMTEQQLKKLTAQQAENDLRIIKDCTKLVESTLKPDVFFMRLNLLLEKAKHLASLEMYLPISGTSPTDAYNEAVNQYHEAINQFLIRYFCDTFDKAEEMKTVKGKLGKYQKFYDSLQEYYCYMNDENIDYIETKYRAYTRKP